MDKLTQDTVAAIMKSCVVVYDGNNADHIIVEMPNAYYAFSLDALHHQRRTIQSLIDQIPPAFFRCIERRAQEGGASILDLGRDREGNEWTEQAQVIEAFVALAAGINRAAFTWYRSFWAEMPGGAPYVTFLHSTDTSDFGGRLAIAA